MCSKDTWPDNSCHMYTQCLPRRPRFIEVRYLSVMYKVKPLPGESLNNKLFAGKYIPL